MDVTSETFEQEVIERSYELPVVVDFWAAWCGPCLRLGPVLEHEAEARAGELALVKVDVEADQELASQYQIQGIPAVKAFRHGQVVREFVGVLPAAAVAQFLDELTGSSATERFVAELEASGELPEAARALERGDHERALELLLEEIGATAGERRERLSNLTVGLFGDLGPEHALPGATRSLSLLMAAPRRKEFHFPLSVEWIGERRVAAHVEGKPSIEAASPPVFRGTDPATWSPEDLFVAAAASCLAITFIGLAARAALVYTKLRVAGDGVAGVRADGRFGFTRLVLRLEVETALTDATQARRLAEEAEETCLVSVSLDLPVETVIEVRQPEISLRSAGVPDQP